QRAPGRVIRRAPRGAPAQQEAATAYQRYRPSATAWRAGFPRGETAMELRDIPRVKGHHVYTVRPDQTVQDAVQILMQHRVGALLVEDAERRAVGIITERDVLRECVDRAAELGRVPVREAMTRDLIIGVPDDEIGYTMGMRTE